MLALLSHWSDLQIESLVKKGEEGPSLGLSPVLGSVVKLRSWNQPEADVGICLALRVGRVDRDSLEGSEA